MVSLCELYFLVVATTTSPQLFLNPLAAVDKDGFWPLRIGVDCEMQNVLVCDAMAEPVFW